MSIAKKNKNDMADRLVDALQSLRSVKILQDTSIPKTPQFGNRVVINFSVTDKSAWAQHQYNFLMSRAKTSPMPKVHMCQQLIADVAKDQLLLVYTLEVAGSDADINAVCNLLRNSKSGPIDVRLRRTTIHVGGSSDRTDVVNSGPLRKISELTPPSGTGRGRGANTIT